MVHTKASLEKMTVISLKALAKKEGVGLAKITRKADIVSALLGGGKSPVKKSPKKTPAKRALKKTPTKKASPKKASPKKTPVKAGYFNSIAPPIWDPSWKEVNSIALNKYSFSGKHKLIGSSQVTGSHQQGNVPVHSDYVILVFDNGVTWLIGKSGNALVIKRNKQTIS